MRNQQSQRRQNSLSPAMIGLLLQLYRTLENSNYKPPVTITFLAINIITHIHPSPYALGYDLTNIQGNCLHPLKIVHTYYFKEFIPWNRLFLSAITHADDTHLYYNMISLCWKGLNLEKTLGSGRFFVLIIFSLFVSPCLHILLSYFLYQIIGLDGYASGYDACAVGFSAVLFSLKYVWNILSPETTRILGIPIASRYAAWAELVLISLLTPNVSFLGHFAGILTGYLYLLLFTGHAPFTALPLPASWTTPLQQIFQRFTGWRARPRYTYYSGPLSGQRADVKRDQEEEEVIEVPLDEGDDDIELEFVEDFAAQQSQQQRSGLHNYYDTSNTTHRRQPNSQSVTSAEELRRRREAHFSTSYSYSGNRNSNNYSGKFSKSN